MHIIGVSGKLGTGKDYLTDKLIKPFFISRGMTVCTMSFADQIKVNVASRNKLHINDMYGTKDPTLRKLLQKEGTELGRDKYGENYWVDQLATWIELRKMRNEVDVVIIPDCRFPNEVEWVESTGGVVFRIEATDRNIERLRRESGGDLKLYDTIANHASEISLDKYSFKPENVIKNHKTTDFAAIQSQINTILTKLVTRR